MARDKTAFALFFGNRGFFPASLMAEAREQLPRLLGEWGHDTLMLPADATNHGAVETTAEGQVYANFLREHRGEFGGVILCLPNFGDETGAVAALREAGVPILVQAYPDEHGKMAPDQRRDAFCGKFSVMDVFCQYDVQFTALKPHVVRPESDGFRANVDYFDRVCRVANGMKDIVVGNIGARTTPFKTVRIDELALQKHGITVETIDLSSVIARAKALSTSAAGYKDKAEVMRGVSNWEGVPESAFENIVRLAVVVDEVVAEYNFSAIAIRCWIELQEQLGVSPCVFMGRLNDTGLPAACETDVGSAITMHALGLASGGAVACLDWNNNYGEEEDKCILFHCSAVPPSMMAGQGKVVDHAILATTLGPERSYGPNTGRLAPCDITFGNMLTDAGRLKFYLGEGAITADPIEDAFFGCAGVAQMEHMEDLFLHIGRHGHRHHVNVTQGRYAQPVREALERYLGLDVAMPQWENGHA